MRIEINAGRTSFTSVKWVKAKVAVGSFASEYSKMVSRAESIVNAFKSVESQIHKMNGGAGTVQPAVDHLENRIEKVDKPKVQKLESAGQRFAMFVSNTIQTDRRVADTLKAVNADFYKVYPWAEYHPPKKPSLWQRIKNGIKNAFKAIGQAFKDAFNWVKDKLKKAWHATVDLLKKHYKTILKIVGGAILIAGLFALSAVTGGAAAGIFALAAKAAVTAALTSTATSVVTGIVQGKSAGEIFDSAGDSFFKGAVTGAISGAVGGVGPAVLEATGSAFFAKGAEILAQGAGDFIGGMITDGVDYLEKNGTLSGFFGDYAKNAGMNVLGSMANSALGAAGDYLKGKAGDILSSATDAFSKTSLGKTVTDVLGNIKDSTSWLTGKDGVLSKIGINGLGDLGINSLDDVKNIFNNPSEFAKNLGGNVLEKVIGSSSVSDMVSSGLSQISNSMGLNDIISTLPNFDFGFNNIDLGKLGDVGQMLNIGDVNISDVVGGFGNGVSDAVSSIGNSISGAVSSIGNSVSNAVNGIGNSVSGAVNSVSDAVNGLGGSISKAVGTAGTGFSDFVNRVGGSANTLLEAAKNTVIDTSKQAVNSLCGSGFANAINDSVSKVTNYANKAVDFINKDHQVTIGFGKSGISLGFS